MIALEVGCFGKLPLHADFIRHRAGPEARRIDTWLQEGLHLLQERLSDVWSEAFYGMPCLRFMRSFADTGRTVVGVITPSHGKAKREFPFLIYATLEDRLLRKRPALIPLLCGDMLARAEQLATVGWDDLDLRSLLARVDALSTSVDPKAAAAQLDSTLRDTSVGVMWSACMPQGTPESRALLLANVHDLCGPRSRPGFPLVFPAPTDDAMASVLMEVMAAARAGEPFAPALTWSNDPSCGLRAVLTEPKATHFLPLFLPQLQSDACFLANEGLESPSLVEKASARYGPLAESAGSPLVDLLRGLST